MTPEKKISALTRGCYMRRPPAVSSGANSDQVKKVEFFSRLSKKGTAVETPGVGGRVLGASGA